jgi:hypothetical protein
MAMSSLVVGRRATAIDLGEVLDAVEVHAIKQGISTHKREQVRVELGRCEQHLERSFDILARNRLATARASGRESGPLAWYRHVAATPD